MPDPKSLLGPLHTWLQVPSMGVGIPGGGQAHQKGVGIPEEAGIPGGCGDTRGVRYTGGGYTRGVYQG